MAKRPRRKNNSNSEKVEDIEVAVSFLEKQISLKRISNRTHQHVSFIKGMATTFGLTAEYIIRIANVIVNSHNLYLNHQQTLIHCLVPSQEVPFKAFLIILWFIGKRKTTRRANILLFKWLIAVYNYDLLNDKSSVSNLYEYIFKFLSHDELFPYASHLLFLITKSHHVSKYRITALLEYYENFDKSEFLMPLLLLYQTFEPEEISVQSTSTKLISLTSWQNAFKAVRALPFGLLQQAKKSLTLRKPFPVNMNTPKDILDLKSVLRSKDLPSIELMATNQFKSIIFSNSPDLSLNYQYKYWKNSMLREEFLLSKPRPNVINHLKTIADVAEDLDDETDTEIFKVDEFLLKYLIIWDGLEHTDEVFRMITSLELKRFDSEQTIMFTRLYQIFICSDAEYQSKYIRALIYLHCRWTLHGMQRLLSQPELHQEAEVILFRLQRHIDVLITTALCLNPDENISILLTGFQFYNSILSLVRRNALLMLYSPSKVFVQCALTSFCPLMVSEVGLLMIRFKEAVDLLKENEDFVSGRLIMSLNALIVESINLIWRGRAMELNFTELPDRVAKKVADPDICFLYTMHPALLNERLKFQNNTGETMEGLIAIGKPRDDYLTFLEGRVSTHGVVRFLKTFVKALGPKT